MPPPDGNSLDASAALGAEELDLEDEHGVGRDDAAGAARAVAAATSLRWFVHGSSRSGSSGLPSRPNSAVFARWASAIRWRRCRASCDRLTLASSLLPSMCCPNPRR